MGKMSDRMWNRFGRRLPYLLFGTPIAALVFIDDDHSLVPLVSAMVQWLR